MYIHCKKHTGIIEGENKYIIPRDYIGKVPEWVENHWYFKALCKDGTITSVVDSTDKEAADAEAKTKAAEKKAAAEAAKKAAEEEAKAKTASGGDGA